MARKREQLADPELIDFYLTLSQALDRTGDDPRLVDPRLVELADRLAAYITRMADEQGEDYVDDVDIEPPLVKLMDTGVRHRAAGPPTDRVADEARLDRLGQARARGPTTGCDQNTAARHRGAASPAFAVTRRPAGRGHRALHACWPVGLAAVRHGAAGLVLVIALMLGLVNPVMPPTGWSTPRPPVP